LLQGTASEIGGVVAEQIKGRVQVQTEDDGLTTIVLNGNTGTVVSGGNGQDGAVTVQDDAGNDRVKIKPAAITVQDASGQIIIQLNAKSGDIQFGAAGARGQVTVHDGQGAATILIGGGEATIEVGAQGKDGDIRLQSSEGVETIHLRGGSARLQLGAPGQAGSVHVTNDQGQETIRLNGQFGNLLMGGSGATADLFLFRDDGDISDTSTATVHADGQKANLYLGGQGTDGDLWLFPEIGDRTDTGSATIHADGQNANLYLGGQGTDGDIWLFPETGDPTDTDTASIHLGGSAGDIILQNADVAEDFDVQDPEALEPGTVVVIGDDSRLRASTQSYDRRVAGVVAGNGSPRPGIILGRHASSPSRLPVALAGRVGCRVDATASPIMVGDLLTTSATPGHAMKADDPARVHGAVIGKALQSQPAGTGVIPILVALQ
jgi:hypothetical protein